MKKLDWFVILRSLVTAIFIILIMSLGGWWIAVGTIFSNLWIWLAIKHYKLRKEILMLEAMILPYVHDVDREAVMGVLQQIGRCGLTVNEFSASYTFQSQDSIGDVTCKWNARSPHLRCAIDPGGECKGCKDYEEA